MSPSGGDQAQPSRPPQSSGPSRSSGPTRPRIRRVLRALLGLSLVLLLLLALAFASLHTRAGGAAVRILLERWASSATGGRVELGTLALSPWKARAAVDGVRLTRDGVSVEAERVELGWSRAGPRLRLLRPEFVVRDSGGPEKPPAAGLAARPWRVLERLDRAEVVEGRVEMRDAKGHPWLVLRRLDAATTREAGRRGVSVRVTGADAGWPEGGLRVRDASAEATLALADGRLVVERARVAVSGSSADVEGAVERISPVTARATGRAALDGVLVESLAPGAGLAGAVETTVAVEVTEDALTGTLTAAAQAIAVRGVGPWAASARGRFEGRRLVLESAEAKGYGGRLLAEGRLALRPSAETDVRVSASGIDVAALARAFSRSAPPVAARADGEVRWATTGWDVAAGEGSGELFLRSARGPGSRGGPALPLSGSVRLRVAGRTLSIERAELQARGARATLEAAIAADGGVRGSWGAKLPLASVDALAADLGLEVRVPERCEGALVAEGELSGAAPALTLGAAVRSEGLAVGGRPHALEAEARYAAGRLVLAPLVLRSGAGRATLGGSVPLLPGRGEWDVEGDVHALPLAPLLALAGLDADGQASGTLRLEGPREEPRTRASLVGRVAFASGDPVTFALAASSAGRRVEVDRLSAETAGGRLEGSGRYDAAADALKARAEADGLAWARLPLLPAALRRLDGTLAGEVSWEGRTRAPKGDLRARLGEVRLDGSPLPALALEAHADGRRIELAGRWGEEPFLVGAGPLEGDWPVRLEIDAAALPAQALLEALPAARDRGATLVARGKLTVESDLLAPDGLRYSGEGLAASGKLHELVWATEPFRVEGDSRALTLRGLRLGARRTALSLDGRVALAPEAAFDLAVEAKADLDIVSLALPGERADGEAALRLRVGGTGEAPEVTGEGSLDGGRGRYDGARWSDLTLRARFLGREAEITDLTARLLGGRLRAQGRLPILDRGPAGPLRLAFSAEDVDLARMLAADLRTEVGAGFLVSFEGEVVSRAPTLAGTRVLGRVLRLESKAPDGRMVLDAPAAFRLEAGRFVQEPLRLTGPLGTLTAQGEARLAAGRGGGTGGGRGGAFSISGPFDLGFLSPFVPDATLAGPARVDARAAWGEGGFRVTGGLAFEGARLALDELAFGATQIAGELRFLGDRLELEASAAAGQGTLRARGGMAHGSSFFGPADVTVEAERIPVAYPEGFRGRATGTLRLKGDPDAAYVISGEVSLRQGYYTAEFDARRQSLERLDWQLAALRGGTIGEMLPLDVDIKLADPLRIRNGRATLDVLGSLTASGTLAQPTATGQVSLREGGTLSLSRAGVRVSRGVVELNGYPAGNPEIDFEGLTRVGGAAINVRARGTFEDLELTLDSPDRPDLSQTDLVALVFTGRTASAAASQGGVIVAEELASALGGVLQKGLGERILVDISPDRSLLADDTDPTQRFNLGTRISDDVLVLYSTALDGTEQRWILDYNPRGGRFRLRVIDEEDESFSFEATDRFSFDLWSRGRRTGPRERREVQRLLSLRLEGELPVPEAELLRVAKLRAGGRYTALQREEGADRVRADLVKRGFRGATVDAVGTWVRASRGVDLVLRVSPGPRVAIRWEGDPLDEDARKAAEAAWPAYASPEVAAAAVARAALVPLQGQRYYAATVVPETRAGGDEVEVVLRVTLGTKGRAVRLEFDGNEALDDRTLVAALPRAGSPAFFDALAGRASGLTDALRLAYARAGYVDARVLPPRSAPDPATGDLVVTFRLRERQVSRVAKVERPAEIVAAGAAGPRLVLKAGFPFDVSAYVADRDAIAAWYRREGWPDARIAGFLDPGPEGVAVRFVVQPGPRPRVGEVRFVQDAGTSPRVVSQAVTLRPGDLIRPLELAESRERLAELGLFRSVEVRPEPRPDQPEVRDIVVDLVPRKDATVEYGLRYSTEGSGGAGAAPSTPAGGRLQVAGALELANPLRWGWRVRGYTFLTSDRQTWGVNVDSASFFGLRLRSQLLVYDDTEDDDVISSLASRVKGVTFQQTKTLLRDLTERRWHDRLRLQWGYTFKDIVTVDDASREQVLAENRAFLSAALIGDGRDSLTDPGRGAFWTATGELSRRFLGSDADYVRLYGQAFLYVPLLGRRLVWAQGFRAGVVPGEDPQLLVENRFRAGGPTTVRGFEQNALGPLTAEGESLGGQAVAVINQELRFPIWRSLHGGVFWDAGNVWLTSAGFDLLDLRQSVGAGLRFVLPFGPIRLEYAWVVKPRTGEAKSRLVFGLGHAF